MKNSHLFAAALATFAFAALTEASYAQNNSLFGNTGGTAGRTTGGTGGLGRTGGTAGGLGGNTGGLPNSANLIQGAAGGQRAGTGNAGFVGRNSNAGRFVGQQQAGTQNSRANRTFRAAGNTGDPNQVNRNTNQGGTNQPTVRPVLRIAFQFRPRTVARMNTNFSTRFRQLAARQPRFQGVSFNINPQGEVVLSGTVPSESAKSLAANLARFEPGVRKVKNQLVVRK